MRPSFSQAALRTALRLSVCPSVFVCVAMWRITVKYVAASSKLHLTNPDSLEAYTEVTD